MRCIGPGAFARAFGLTPGEEVDDELGSLEQVLDGFPSLQGLAVEAGGLDKARV